MAQGRIDFISPEEFQKLYAGAKGNKELRIAMTLGFGSGLRISEIVGLKYETSKCCALPINRERVKNIDTGKSYKRMMCSGCGKTITMKEFRRDTKNGLTWKIKPLTPDMVDLPGHLINILGKGGKWGVTILPPNFTEDMKNSLPLKIPRTTLQYQFSQLAKRELGKKMSFHTLRHGFGNYQANILKMPLPRVQGFMRHSRLDTTGIYTKANPVESIADAWKAMGGA